jgi:HSP20 family molecular chaperone IbpA
LFGEEVAEDTATADMKNGLLMVRVPKSAKVLKGSKKLSIKAA